MSTAFGSVKLCCLHVSYNELDLISNLCRKKSSESKLMPLVGAALAGCAPSGVFSDYEPRISCGSAFAL